MTWPCDKQYGISATFRQTGKYWKACGWHTGTDFAAPMGATVYAPIAGTIRHRNYGSAFGPFQFAISPSPGQPFADEECFIAHTLDRLPDGTEVQAGQRIARCGDLGNVSAAHIHVERHSRKNIWDCSVMLDPMPMINHGGGSTAPETYITRDIYSDRLGYGQKDSDTVKELQRLLNGIKLVGGTNLPITGNYLDLTDAEVRKWQDQVCGDTPDPAGRSYLGPRQRAKMFPSPPYVLHDKGLPAIAGSSGGDGAGGGPDVGGDPDLPVPAWFVPASLSALRDEVNARWPNRDKSSDGTIGDTAHSTSKSEHNPVGHRYGPEFGTPGAVHAMDITAAGIDVQRVLDSLIGDQRVWYVIHNAYIWSKTYGWEQRPYQGSNPHTTHIHVSLAADDQASAVRNEKDIATWLETVTLPPPETGTGEYVTREEFDEWRQQVADAIDGGD